MARAPWYKRYAADFVSDPYVQAMTAEQYGWFSAMLDYSWIHSPIGRLPNDLPLICRMIGRCDEMYFVQHSKIVIDRFKTSPDGQWLYHPKMLEQAEKLSQISENKSHPGKAGRKKTAPCKEIESKSDDFQNEIKRGGESESDTDTERTKKNRQFSIPDWVPAEQWEAYVEMRRIIGKKFTPRGKELAIAKLDKLRQQGNDPTAVLNNSIFNSWQGLFPVNEASNGKNQPVRVERISAQQSRIERNRQASADFLRERYADSVLAEPGSGAVPPRHSDGSPDAVLAQEPVILPSRSH